MSTLDKIISRIDARYGPIAVAMLPVVVLLVGGLIIVAIGVLVVT